MPEINPADQELIARVRSVAEEKLNQALPTTVIGPDGEAVPHDISQQTSDAAAEDARNQLYVSLAKELQGK